MKTCHVASNAKLGFAPPGTGEQSICSGSWSCHKPREKPGSEGQGSQNSAGAWLPADTCNNRTWAMLGKKAVGLASRHPLSPEPPGTIHISSPFQDAQCCYVFPLKA